MYDLEATSQTLDRPAKPQSSNSSDALPNFAPYMALQTTQHIHSKLYSLQWHPKLTPYRLLTLLLTVSLGTAKAILTFQDKSTNSVTLEWVLGVVVSLVPTLTNTYDCAEQPPRFFSWFFSFDCMEWVWRAMEFSSFTRPIYSSDERTSSTTTPATRPPITGYRLLVSFSVIVLGISKAALSYLGVSTAATAFDWILTATVTSILYCVGLYQNNSKHLWPSFFETNYSSQVWGVVDFVGHASLYTGGIVFFVGWCTSSSYALVNFLNAPFKLGAADGGSPTFIDNAHDLSLKIMGAFLLLAIILLGLAGIVWMAWLSKRALIPRSIIRPIFRAARRRLLVTLRNMIPENEKGEIIQNFLNQGSSALPIRVLIHVSLHALGALACTTLGLFWFGFGIRMWDSTSLSKEGLIVGTVLWAFIAFSLAMAVPCALITFLVLKSLVKPLSLYHNPREFMDSLLSP